MLAAVGRTATATDLPTTADLESGYGDVATTIRRAVALGVAGANLEDALRPLPDAVRMVEQAVRAAATEGVPLVLNARTDRYLQPQGQPPAALLTDALQRGQAFLDAGANCVFVGRVARGVPADRRAALLVPQDGQCPVRPAQVGPHRGQDGARGDLPSGGQRPRQEGRGSVADAYGTKWPKAAGKIARDLAELLAFYDYPAEHWIHLRTTNPIESTFATVRHRTKLTRGPGSKAAGLAMAFKLIEAAQAGWRAVNAPHLVALVRAGAVFHAGQLVERPDEQHHNQPNPAAEKSVPAAA